MLTDTQCRTAKPKEKLYRLNDFNGLYLEVKPNGKKAWRYRFKLNGKSSMFALGEYPTVKLAEAREKCEQARKQVADGVSPTQARQLDKIRKALPANKTQHKQALNPQQIGKLLSCFDNSRGSYQVNYCMWLMWWTLARPAEATEAEWTEFDLNNALWTIPAARMKARREHVIPLPFSCQNAQNTTGVNRASAAPFPGQR